MGKTKIGEWLWRFLTIVMMFSVGWTIWIIYQLNPPSLVMNAAFEAAAKAKDAPAEAPKERPINPEKLKFSESIALPVPAAKK